MAAAAPAALKKVGFVNATDDTARAAMEAANAFSRIAATGTFRGTASFNVVIGTRRVTALITSTPEFIERYWEELRALGGWTRRGIQFREDVNVGEIVGIASENTGTIDPGATAASLAARLGWRGENTDENTRRYKTVFERQTGMLAPGATDIAPPTKGNISAAVSYMRGESVRVPKQVRKAVDQQIREFQAAWGITPPAYVIDEMIKLELTKLLRRRQEQLLQKSRELGRPLTEAERLEFLAAISSSERTFGRRTPGRAYNAGEAYRAATDEDGAGAGAGAFRGGRRHHRRTLKNRRRR